MNVSNMMSMVESIADVLYLRLGLYTPRNGEPGIRNLPCKTPVVNIMDGVTLPMIMNVKASYVGPSAAAALFRVRGDLYVYVACSGKTQTQTVVVLSARKLPFVPKLINLLDGLHPNQAKDVLEPGAVGMYVKLRSQTEWQQKDIANAQTMVG